MRKYVLGFLLVLLSSCSIVWKEADSSFQSSYTQITHYLFSSSDDDIEEINDLYERFYPSGTDNSWLSLIYDLQDTWSWNLFLWVDAVRETFRKMGVQVVFSWVAEIPTGEIATANMKGEFMYDSTIGKYFGKLDEYSATGFFATDLELGAYYMLEKWYAFDIFDLAVNAELQSKDLKIWVFKFEDFMKIELNLLTDIQINGTKNIENIISTHPILAPTEEVRIEEEYFVYPVVYSRTWATDFADAFFTQYTGSGMDAGTKAQVYDYLGIFAFTGVLKVAKNDPANFTLSGVFTDQSDGSQEISNVSLDSQTDRTDISILNDKVRLHSLFEKHMNAWNYSLEVLNLPENDNENILATYKKEDWVNSFHIVFAAPGESTWGLTFIWPDGESGNFYGFFGNNTKKDYLEFSWGIDKKVITSLSWTIEISSQDIWGPVIFDYSRDKDDNFKGSYSGFVPGLTSEFSGRAKREDFFIEANIQWITAKIVNKKINDSDWEWFIQTPAWKVDWLSKIESDTLKSLQMNLISPFAKAKIDLKEDGDWARGAYTVSFQDSEVSSGTLSLMRKPKYFGIGIKTIIPNIESTLPSFFEFVGMSDIKWDKDTKVVIPTNYELINLQEFSENMKKAAQK